MSVLKCSELWELISEDTYTFTKRLSVPSGWIVQTGFEKNYISNPPGDVQLQLVFVPDPNHDWTI